MELLAGIERVEDGGEDDAGEDEAGPGCVADSVKWDKYVKRDEGKRREVGREHAARTV